MNLFHQLNPVVALRTIPGGLPSDRLGFERKDGRRKSHPHPSIQEDKKNILILGGSYGGISVAHYILKHTIRQLPEKESYHVVLVSASSQVMCRPACPRALISDHLFDQEKLFVSIPKAFEQFPKESFRFINGTVTELDHSNRTVSVSVDTGNDEKIKFHALVIATGAKSSSPLFGLHRDVDFLRANWNAFRKALPNAKNIIVVGGGPTRVETAGELGDHLNGRVGFLRS